MKTEKIMGDDIAFGKLSDRERNYLDNLFFEHQKETERRMFEEMAILSKYKGELAKNYSHVVSNQSTLVGCMQDIIKNQETLVSLSKLLHNFMARLERFYDVDALPKNAEFIDRSLLVDDLFATLPLGFNAGLPRKVMAALMYEGITHIHQLQYKKIFDLLRIKNLGPKGIALVIYMAEKKGINLELEGKLLGGVKRELARLKEQQPDNIE